MEEKRLYGASVHIYLSVEADVLEEAFEIIYEKMKDALHFTGASKQAGTIKLAGEEDELDAYLEAEWENGKMRRVKTDREEF